MTQQFEMESTPTNPRLSIEEIAAALKGYDPDYYTDERLNSLTKNDMLYALLLFETGAQAAYKQADAEAEQATAKSTKSSKTTTTK